MNVLGREQDVKVWFSVAAVARATLVPERPLSLKLAAILRGDLSPQCEKENARRGTVRYFSCPSTISIMRSAGTSWKRWVRSLAGQ